MGVSCQDEGDSTVTDDEVDDYVRFLRAHLPPAQAQLSEAQVRAVLDAEAVYFERRFGPIHGWRALLRSFIGRGEPPPASVEAALPEFEQYVAAALAGRGDLTREDIRTVMRVEGEAGPHWTPPQPPPDESEPGPASAEGDLPPPTEGDSPPTADGSNAKEEPYEQ